MRAASGSRSRGSNASQVFIVIFICVRTQAVCSSVKSTRSHREDRMRVAAEMDMYVVTVQMRSQRLRCLCAIANRRYWYYHIGFKTGYGLRGVYGNRFQPDFDHLRAGTVHIVEIRV